MGEAEALEQLRRLEIETPSWGYGNSGTRFHVYPWPGAARDVYERIADAALVHELTGCCPSVAIHVPWDRVDDWRELRAYAEGRGIRHWRRQSEPLRRRRLPAREPLQSRRRGTRRQALDHCLECVAIAAEVGSSELSLWLAGRHQLSRDRTTCAARFRRLLVSLQELYSALPSGMRLLVEYKFFEPAFYSTDLPDWGTAALVCRRLGPAGAGTSRHRPPPARNERGADRGPLARRGVAWRLPLQQPQVRRRRSHGRLDRPVRALPHHARDRGGTCRCHDRLDSRSPRPHDRPVPQRRGEDRRDDPVGRQHPDGVREGAPR